MQQKSTKLWVTLLVLPIPLLIVTAIVQFFARTASQGNNDNDLMNTLGFLVGTAALVMLLGIPVWIIMLIKTINHNKNSSTQTNKT